MSQSTTLAFRMQLKPGRVDEYRRRHDAEFGIQNLSDSGMIGSWSKSSSQWLQVVISRQPSNQLLPAQCSWRSKDPNQRTPRRIHGRCRLL